MRRRCNLLQWTGIHVRDGRSGGRAPRIDTTVFDVAVLPIESWGVGVGDRERALAGLSIRRH